MNGDMKSLTSQEFENSVITLVEDAKNSAAGLVNILADRFPCFRDEHTFEKRKVRILKRAQILVADLWAAFEGEGYGEFNDMNKITIFAGKQKKRYFVHFMLTTSKTTASLKFCAPSVVSSTARLSKAALGVSTLSSPVTAGRSSYEVCILHSL
jgi:hypothetical protein